MSLYHVGIDPGATGGIAVIDGRGQFVAAHRWQPKEPRKLFLFLSMICNEIVNKRVYIERIQSHPGEGLGHVVNNMSLVENFGLWQGFLIAAGLEPVLVHPATWQVAHNLRNWQANLKKNPLALTPLKLARRLWPAAPLPAQADDGKAAALLLADLFRRDHIKGIDRAALNLNRETKAKAARAKARAARREAKNAAAKIAQPSRQPAPPAPPAQPPLADWCHTPCTTPGAVYQNGPRRQVRPGGK